MLKSPNNRDLDIALDIGKHAEAEAFAAIMRVLSLAPDHIQPIAMAFALAHLQITQMAMREALNQKFPELLTYLDSAIEKASNGK